MGGKRYNAGFNRRVDKLSYYEQYRMRQDAKNLVENPFKVGDRVETIDFYGNPLKTGIYKGHNYTTKGALRIHFLRDDGVNTYAYYPGGIRKAASPTLAIVVYQEPCTAMVVYKPSNIIQFEQVELPMVAEQDVAA